MSRLAIACLAFSVLAGCGSAVREPPSTGTSEGAADAGVGEETRVHASVQVFILARCPHCASLMRTLLDLKSEMGQALDLSVGYVGAVDELGRPDLSYGDAEVRAAEVQICAGLNSDAAGWSAFLGCLYAGDAWRSLTGKWEGCADEAGVDTADIAACLESGEGREALEVAVAASAATGVEAAPTVFVDDRFYAGGRDRDALLSYLCHLAGRPETRPPACDGVPSPSSVEATLLVDSRCDDDYLCGVDGEVAFLEVLIPTLGVQEVDFTSKEGRAMFDVIVKADGPSHLPLLILDGAVEDNLPAMEQIGEYLLPFGKGYILPLGEGWDPLAEICDNGSDDTGDGLADCDDPACEGTLPCREEVPGRIDFFLMSQCPFATRMMPSVAAFVDHFGRDRREVDLELQFIGHDVDGELESMHGAEEVAEDLRMACVQDLYGKDYAHMEYVTCRAHTYLSTDWEPCVPRKMSAARIRKCAEGRRGRELLAESFALAEKVGVIGSPSWILNNRFEMEGRSAEEIVAAFCERNDLPACEREVAPVAGEKGATADICR